MITMPLAALLIGMFSLPFSTTTHAAESKVVGVKDGLELIVSHIITPSSPHSTIECSLHNTTDQDIPFDLSGPTYRLTFRLLDVAGAEIAMEPQWQKLNGTVDPAFNARHSSSAIKPGLSRTFTFHPDEAYGNRWKYGVRLAVSWEPGIDWSTEKPYTKGRGLTVGFEIERAGR